MYAVDQSAIASRIHAAAVGTHAHDTALLTTYAMVAVTIRNETPFVLSHCLGALRDGDRARTWRFTVRRNALRVIRSGEALPVLRRVHGLMRAGMTTQAHMALCVLPWLDYVKAGFYLQLAYGVMGCIDSRNAKALGLNVKKLVGGMHGDAPKRTRAGRERQRDSAIAYADLCTAQGGSAGLWDFWCSGASAQWPDRYPTADDVSREHVRWYDTLHAALWRDAGDIARVHAVYPDTQSRMDALPAHDAPTTFVGKRTAATS
jgi:hypothetical protein